jgi:hypothetical protein
MGRWSSGPVGRPNTDEDLPQWHLHSRHPNATSGPLLRSTHLRSSISELLGLKGGPKQLGGGRLEGEVVVLDAKRSLDR